MAYRYLDYEFVEKLYDNLRDFDLIMSCDLSLSENINTLVYNGIMDSFR